MAIPEIPAVAMEYAEQVFKTILKTVQKMFSMALGPGHKLIIIALRPNEDGSNAYVVVSDIEDKREMATIMHDAARRAVDGSMLDGEDFKEPKH